MAKKKGKKVKCPKCGFDGFKKAKEIKGYKRIVPGNAVCAKCGHPVPHDI